MPPERRPSPPPPPPDTLVDLTDVATAIFSAQVEALKEAGLLRRVEEITDEWELDDHFDDLARLYRQVCVELGLPWPPPPHTDP